MKSCYDEEEKNGYQETISLGVRYVSNLKCTLVRGNKINEADIFHLKEALKCADAICIGAGAGLSTAAGFTYSGERFEKYFFDYAEHFGISDMYSGGFYPFPDVETRWAWWAREIYVNRFVEPPRPVYKEILELVQAKEYFVITTNVDHLFQKAGFAKQQLFYTQGDYGLFQSVNPHNRKTYDNEAWVMQAIESEGFVKNETGFFEVPPDRKISMCLPTELLPKCPDDGSDVTMNLRADDTFVEDAGWHKASQAYADFLARNADKKVLFLELGVGSNTPVIVKYPFWAMTEANKNSFYACVNYGEAYYPKNISSRSICINADILEVIKALKDGDFK